MIVYRFVDGLNCPVILCDVCRKQITNSGNVYWISQPDRDTSSFWFTHKWPCSYLDRAIEKETGALVLFEELDRWMKQLAHNFRYPLELGVADDDAA